MALLPNSVLVRGDQSKVPIMNRRTEVLEKLADAVLARLEQSGNLTLRQLAYVDYHGFQKMTLPAQSMEPMAASLGFASNSVQAELVRVRSDLRHEVHHHQRAWAFAVALGEPEGFDPPRRAFAFLGGEWRPVSAGDRFSIPPGVRHGFTVETGGELTFLSLQSPPITGEHGDDYHRSGSTA